MLWASHWQYTRYIDKQKYIAELDLRLAQPIASFESLFENLGGAPDKFYHRRVSISGEWDYENEVILRNRKFNNEAGVYVVTPLKLEHPKDQVVLVSRGFIPLSHSESDSRKIFRKDNRASLTGIIKAPQVKRLFSPSDDKIGPDLPRLDAWLRINPAEIEKQLPYQLLPFYIETIPESESQPESQDMIQQKSERDQILFMPRSGVELERLNKQIDTTKYPIPVFDTVVPAARHFSYIFEWLAMAIGTIIIGIIMQLKRSY